MVTTQIVTQVTGSKERHVMRKQVGIVAAAGAVIVIGGAIVISIAHTDDDERGTDRQNAFLQTNLVSNRSDVRAKVIDPHVKNPWGMASALGGPLWVADNGASASTVYTLQNDVPQIQGLVVKLAAQDHPDKWAPTGLVHNPNPHQFRFQGEKQKVGAVFIFASEDGRIVAWNPEANADDTIANTVVTTPNAIYKGLALATNADGNFIFATNFHAGTVEAFDTSFTPNSRFRFIDRNIPAGFAPFGIANIDGELFVSFAKQDADKEDDVAGAGNGFVDVFTTRGELVRRLVSRGALNSPWGMTRAPIGFGKFGGAILIGNFGDGRINAFDNHGNLLGALRGRNGQPIVINGLWALMFGVFTGADPEDLYFTAGINDEKDGVIGELSLGTGRH
jgi:uncharacterized protein (TIGR03118 family)